METYSTLLALCAGNSPVDGEFLAQRPVTWSFDDLISCAWINDRVLQLWGWWFESPSRLSWCHCNGTWTRWRYTNRITVKAACIVILAIAVHYNDVKMSAVAFQITSLTIVYSTLYSGSYQWKHQNSATLAFVRGIHRSPVNSPHKGPVTRKTFPFDDVIMVIFQTAMVSAS